MDRYAKVGTGGFMRVLLFGVVFLVGCGMQPYSEVGIGYVLRHDGPYLGHCKYPFVIGAGLSDGKQSITIQHRSNIDCGDPVGSSYDSHTESIMYKRRFYWGYANE